MNEQERRKRQGEIQQRGAYTAAKTAYMDPAKRTVAGDTAGRPDVAPDSVERPRGKTPSEAVAEAQAKAAAQARLSSGEDAGNTSAEV